MRTKINLGIMYDPCDVKESYATVKGRLAKGDEFIEVTTEQGKVTWNKHLIERVSEIARPKVLKVKGKAHDQK